MAPSRRPIFELVAADQSGLSELSSVADAGFGGLGEVQVCHGAASHAE